MRKSNFQLGYNLVHSHKVKGEKFMWYEFLLEGLKNFAGEIIGTLLLIFVLWAFPGLLFR